ncbi:type II toxin-antitoxin system HipA family toxin [Paraburkholderia caballeronis]|uniref:type II toxin-antitoxin system HipA family toxin n=1 Tax=Paraburkholderia caballeronis TaxID=416943 RepID=UPI00106620E5|nr:type II toxin-antitoxin system HipA family toxin [Paraburkholderia caballeronis]TDV19540.1 serine/threonine-protein kinase HipA [Paraburkholderia caballeronis]TDV22140.1 serine/threonine-protein kinase HipA [Paraburkholderia caballeronis]TDV29044.1 serine/threonine-protein kinase HipA [Paraburkholderia caballeronis]
MVIRIGQAPRHRRLNLWMNGLPVGYWEVRRGNDVLSYWPEWVDDEQGRPLSLSLPFLPGNLPHNGQVVADYFDNLLPDSADIRRRIAARYKTPGTSPYDLLTALGRDCVGAIQLLAPSEQPTDLETIHGLPLDEAAVARLLRDTTTGAAPGQPVRSEDLRLSIAGAQEKTALLRHKGQWLLPTGSTPTTHILKLPLGLVGGRQADMRTSVENEWLCAQIVAAYGLPVAHCDMAGFEDQKVLVVERFDRRLSSDGRWIMRLPQEDMCQATGTPARAKYQTDGGPGIEKIMEILSRSATADLDRRNFFFAQIVFWLLAATDGHAKNFSIAHRSHHQYVATPLYDILSVHPIVGRGANHIPRQDVRLAMSVRGKNLHYHVEEILPRHWIAQGSRVGFAADEVEEMLVRAARSTGAVIDAVAAALPRGFPQDVADAVFSGMRRLSRKLPR